jgi:bacillithiol biosynthesis cysteine-adding enzyme BshC
MQKQIVSRSQTGLFSDIANRLVESQETLDKFIEAPFSKASLLNQAKKKQNTFPKERRSLLYNTLSTQLSGVASEKVQNNLASLKEEHTFTITTGHQLNLYSGPLYVVYKIMHVIKLAEELSKSDSANNYVPLFWMATEDHDFEEINHLHLFNDTVSWKTDQKGPVGRFDLEDFDSTKHELLDKFQNNENFAEFLGRYYSHGTLAEATREFVMDLFVDYGLLVLDADDVELKRSFSPILEEELTNPFAESCVEKSTKALDEEGIGSQVTPRPINLFYITKGRRDRIIPDDGNFQVGEDYFSMEEMLTILESNPERFSPNVVLRPVFQEYILPNICYVGGGGEMAYWLQLKGVFDHISLPYPVIQVRNSVQFIDGIAFKKMNKLNLTFNQLFDGIHSVKKQFVLDHGEDALDFAELESKQEELVALIDQVVGSVDKALDGYGRSEIAKLGKQIDGIKQKLVRHQKKRHDDEMSQIENLFERLFPADGLQERYDNVIPKLAKYGKDDFLQELYKHMDPFEKGLIVITED